MRETVPSRPDRDPPAKDREEEETMEERRDASGQILGTRARRETRTDGQVWETRRG